MSDPLVKLGQVWRDNDPRQEKSRIGKVVSIDITDEKVEVEWAGSHRRTWCALSRFNGKANGYGLVEDVDPKPARKRSGRRG